jgi:AraC-like DNA-binding protein
MTIRFSLASVLMLLGALQGFLLFAALMAPGRRKSAANRILAVLMLLTAVRLLHVAGHYARIEPGSPLSLGWTLSLIYTYPPLLFLYIKALTTPSFLFRTRLFLHFLPAAAVFALQALSSLKALGGTGNAPAGSFARAWNSFSETPLTDVLWLIQTLVYLGLIVRVRRRHAAGAAGILSDEARVRLRWIQHLAAAFLFLCGLEVVFLGSLVFGGPIVPSSGAVLYVSVAAIVCLWGYFGLRQPEIFRPADIEPAAKLPVLPGAEPERRPGLAERLSRFMAEKKPYLDPDLTIYDLARALDIPVYQLSAVLNKDLGRTFFDFVNGYRIDEAKRNLADPGLKSQKILAIALDCGFASKSAFNRVFKEMAGETPSSYRAKKTSHFNQ